MEKTTETEITPTHTHVFNYIGQGIETCVCGAVMWDNTQPHVIDKSDPDIADYIKHNTKDLDPSEDWTGLYNPI